MPVLAAMGEREAGGIGEPARRAVQHLGDQRQRPDGARADAGHQKELGEIRRAARRRGCQVAVEAAHDHVAFANLVVSRHDEMRQERLPGRLPPFGRGEFADDAVRSEIGKEIELDLT